MESRTVLFFLPRICSKQRAQKCGAGSDPAATFLIANIKVIDPYFSQEQEEVLLSVGSDRKQPGMFQRPAECFATDTEFILMFQVMSSGAAQCPFNSL